MITDPNTPNDWENPLVCGRNKLAPRTTICSFTSSEDARASVARPLLSKNVLPLNGSWSFKLFSSPQQALDYATKFLLPKCVWDQDQDPNSQENGLEWDNVAVPGCWQLQSLQASRQIKDLPMYLNIDYVIPITPPYVPSHNPTGVYKLWFKVPESLRSIDHTSQKLGAYLEKDRVVLHFGGVDSAFYVFLNGKQVGFSKDSKSPAEFDVSNLIRSYTEWNQLVCVVIRWNDGYYLEDQDHWQLSGIHRDVYLIHTCSSRAIKDFWYDSRVTLAQDLKAAPISALLQVYVQLEKSQLGSFSESLSTPEQENDYDHTPHWILDVALYDEGILDSAHYDDHDLHLVYPDDISMKLRDRICSKRVPLSQESVSENGQVSVPFHIASPALWSPAEPYLYTLVISLILEDDYSVEDEHVVVQVESCRVGFRHISVSNGLLLFNGHSLLVNGANRHEHHELFGKTVPKSTINQDVVLMKQFNFNAVRTSHYPNHIWFYELCDRLGLHLIDEANIETHGMKPTPSYLADHADWEEAYMQRFQTMYFRDRNHPCIIAWSLGNEAGYGIHHDTMSQWYRNRSDDRLLVYEPASYSPNSLKNPEIFKTCTDVICPMYPTIEECTKYGEQQSDKPLILVEYAHGMGNSSGNLKEWFDLFRGQHRLQGGFIWDWVDQGILKTDKAKNASFWAYGGDFGEQRSDMNFVINGIMWPDRTPHPGAWEFRKLGQPLNFTLHGCELDNNECKLGFHVLNDWHISVDVFEFVEIGYEIALDGKVLPHTVSNLRIESVPLESNVFDLGVNLSFQLPSEPKAVNTVSITITAKMRYETPWCPVGHEVAWEQFDVSQQTTVKQWKTLLNKTIALRKVQEQKAMEKLVFETTEMHQIIVCSKNIKYYFDNETGQLQCIKVGDIIILGDENVKKCYYKENSICLQLHRAPTDNDKGGWLPLWDALGLNEPLIGPRNVAVETKAQEDVFSLTASFRLHSRIKSLGLAKIVHTLYSFVNQEKEREIVIDTESDEESKLAFNFAGSFCLSRKYVTQRQIRVWKGTFIATTSIVSESEDPNLAAFQQEKSVKESEDEEKHHEISEYYIECETTYVIETSGSLSITWKVDIDKRFLTLPRVGLRLNFSSKYDHVEWFGKGEHETYPDRKQSGRVGIYERDVKNMFTPYIVPSENGNRTDVRWLKMSNNCGEIPTILIKPIKSSESSHKPFHFNGSEISENYFNFSALEYSTEELTKAMHPFELQKDGKTYVNLDHLISGVGGDTSWTVCVYKKYRCNPGKYHFGFELKLE